MDDRQCACQYSTLHTRYWTGRNVGAWNPLRTHTEADGIENRKGNSRKELQTK